LNDKQRIIGAHVRIDHTLQDMLEQIAPLQMNALQFFLFKHHENKYLRLNKDDLIAMKKFKKSCSQLYAHSSYWINLAHGNQESFAIAERLLAKELSIAERLDLTGLVIHPGSYKGHPRSMTDAEARQRALEQIARLLNRIFRKKSSVSIIFENTTCQKKTIGSNFIDFYELKQLLDAPETLQFCIDFAHAHVWGYDVHNTDAFIQQLEQTIGIEAIALLHLHDAAELAGSCQDRHALIGEGSIGLESLKNLALHKALVKKPVILELPKTTLEKTKQMLDLVTSWEE
jgi:deoxyribonuclease-4